MLLAANVALASNINNPRFFEYQGRGFINETIYITFGWFKTLSTEQKASYSQSLTHAVMFAENGQKVEWYKDDASGYAIPVLTWPTGSGYCRQIHIQAIAYGVEKTMSQTACFDNAHTNWRWLKQ